MTMQMNSCPACGSEDLYRQTSAREIRAPYGPTIKCTVIEAQCCVCKESFTTDDTPLQAAKKRSEQESVATMLASLATEGYTPVAIERILGIPFGILSKKPVDSQTLALLRMVTTYPWMLAEEIDSCSEDVIQQRDIWRAGLVEAAVEFVLAEAASESDSNQILARGKLLDAARKVIPAVIRPLKERLVQRRATARS
jgi:hypothetical protein